MFSFQGQYTHLAGTNPAAFGRGAASHKPDLFETRAMIQAILNDASSLAENLNMLTERLDPQIAEGAEKLTEDLPVDDGRALHAEKADDRPKQGWTITSADATNPLEAWLQRSRVDLTEDEPEDEEKEALFG